MSSSSSALRQASYGSCRSQRGSRRSVASPPAVCTSALEPGSRLIPAYGVASPSGKVTWMIDAHAAQSMSTGTSSSSGFSSEEK